MFISWSVLVCSIITIYCVGMMLRPLSPGGGMFHGFDAITRPLWLIPVLLIWLIYFILN